MSCEARRDDGVEVGREDDAMLTGAAGTEFRSGAILFLLRLVCSCLVDGVKVRGAEPGTFVLIVCSKAPVSVMEKACYRPCHDPPR